MHDIQHLKEKVQKRHRWQGTWV